MNRTMLNDTLLLGGIAGAVGNIVKEASVWFLYYLGYLQYTFVHFCAGIYLSPSRIKEPAALLLGILTDYTIAVVWGLGIYIILKRTGIAFWVIKGLGFGLGIFVSCYGILRPVLSPQVTVDIPLTNLLYLIPHLVFGVTVCWFIYRFGKVGAGKIQK